MQLMATDMYNSLIRVYWSKLSLSWTLFVIRFYYGFNDTMVNAFLFKFEIHILVTYFIDSILF